MKYKLSECMQCGYKFVTLIRRNICPKCYSDNLKILKLYKSLTEYEGKEDVIETPIYNIVNGKIKCNTKRQAYKIMKDLRNRKIKCDWLYHLIDKCYYVEILSK